MGLLLEHGANPEAVALWVAKFDLTLRNHPLILKLNMNSFCSNYIIFWWLLMNSIQRRSNPFQLRQCAPRQNLQARMKIVDINITLWWDQLLSILLRCHTLATKVKSFSKPLSQYQCITQNRCNAFNKTLLVLHIKASIFRDLLEEAVKKRGKGFPVLSCSEWIYLT